MELRTINGSGTKSDPIRPELRVRCSLGKRAANSVVLALPVESTGVPILKKY